MKLFFTPLLTLGQTASSKRMLTRYEKNDVPIRQKSLDFNDSVEKAETLIGKDDFASKEKKYESLDLMQTQHGATTGTGPATTGPATTPAPSHICHDVLGSSVTYREIEFENLKNSAIDPSWSQCILACGLVHHRDNNEPLCCEMVGTTCSYVRSAEPTCSKKKQDEIKNSGNGTKKVKARCNIVKAGTMIDGDDTMTIR
jgi:hypothetical protein